MPHREPPQNRDTNSQCLARKNFPVFVFTSAAESPRYQRRAEREEALSILRQGVGRTAPSAHVFPEALGCGIRQGGGCQPGSEPSVRLSGSLSGVDTTEGGFSSVRASPRQARSGGADGRGFGHGRGNHFLTHPSGLTDISDPGCYVVPGPGATAFTPIGLTPAPSFLRAGSAARHGVGGGMPLAPRIRPRFERRLFGSSTAGRTIEAHGPIERSSGASSIFRGRVLDGRNFED